MILELYASGNIILTDHTFLILALLRTHEYAEGTGAAGGEAGGGGGGAAAAAGKGGGGGDGPGALVSVGQVYPMALATNVLGPGSSSSSNSGTITAPGGDSTRGDEQEKAKAKEDMSTTSALTGEAVLAALHERVAHEAAQESNSAIFSPQPTKKGKTKRGGQGKQGGGASKMNLKMALMTSKTLGVAGYGPALIEHAILGAGLLPLQKIVLPTPAPAPPPPSLPPPATEAQNGEGDKGEGGGGKGEAAAVAVVAATTLAVSLEEANRLAESLQGLEGVVTALDLPGQQGYILCKKEEARKAEEEAAKPEEEQGEGKEETRVLYDEFLPHVLHQHQQVRP